MEYSDSYTLKPDEELGIDPERLDVEWIKHPDTFHKYAHAAADAERTAKEAAENVKVIRSELIRKANKNPERYLGKGNKATGTNVEAYYRKHPDHIEAKEELIEAEYERDIIQAAKSAMFMKKVALESLVKLAMQGWFASPVAPKTMTELKEQIDEADARTTSSMVKKAKDQGKMGRRRKPAGK